MRHRSGLTVFPAHGRTALKVLRTEGKTTTVGGQLVVFDEPGTKSRDLAGEYFTADTYFGGALAKGDEALIEATYNHGVVKQADLAPLTEHEFEPLKVTRTDTGLMAELILDERKAYEKMLAGLVRKGALGWSSGSATHRVKVADDGQIERWPLVEGALTPTPCEPRAKAGAVAPLKSLLLEEYSDWEVTEAGLIVPTNVTKAHSLNRRIEAVYTAFRAAYPYCEGCGERWVAEVWDEHAIVRIGQSYFRAPYTYDEATQAATLAEQDEWTAVVERREWVEAAGKSYRAFLAEEGTTESATPGDEGDSPESLLAVLTELNDLL